MTSVIWKIDYFGNAGPVVRTVLNGWTLSAIGTVRFFQSTRADICRAEVLRCYRDLTPGPHG